MGLRDYVAVWKHYKYFLLGFECFGLRLTFVQVPIQTRQSDSPAVYPPARAEPCEVGQSKRLCPARHYK